MSNYDVTIIGAGPAGCQCARQLSKQGKKVLLVEKAKSFSTNNFSSGGAPIKIMNDFQLSDEVIGTYWNKISIHSSNEKTDWNSINNRGVVLDFMKLRTFLTNEAQNNNCHLHMHSSYVSHQKVGPEVLVQLKNHDDNLVQTIKTKYLVDATGVERSVLQGDFQNSNIMEATGIEYLIEVPAKIYEKYSKTLTFYFGLKWMPQGYAWIFAMPNNQLKVGIIRYFPHEKFSGTENSYKFYLNSLIENCLETDKPVIIDKHGKTLIYSYGQKDPHFQNNTLAIGDAISTLNPMACEGIRHALASGSIAAHHLSKALENPSYNFSKYSRDIRKYCGYKWKICEFLMNRFYRHSSDKKIDLFLKSLTRLSFDDLLHICFDYQFIPSLKFYLYYLTSLSYNCFPRN